MNKVRDAAMILICMVFLVGCSDTLRESVLDMNAPRTIHAIGYVEPRRQLRRLTFEGQGVISVIYVDVGEYVKTGDVLAQLDTRRAMAELEVARGLLAVAEAELALLDAGAHPEAIRVAEAILAAGRSASEYRAQQRDRLRALAQRRGVSEADFEEADYLAKLATYVEEQRVSELDFLKNQTRDEELLFARAKVAEANGRVNLATAYVASMAILAPTDGRVVDVIKQAGEGVSHIMPAAVLLFVPDGPMEVRAEVDESFWGTFAAGDKVTIRTSGGQHAEGQVRLVKGLMGNKTVFTRSAIERMDLKIFETWIELPEDMNWPVGMEVAVEINI